MLGHSRGRSLNSYTICQILLQTILSSIPTSFLARFVKKLHVSKASNNKTAMSCFILF
uniref:Uncharacterized protein n=1 Tax=Octopus bimaculoides TaxID=37653 RepID=A0A0L8GD24_OCTBM